LISLARIVIHALRELIGDEDADDEAILKHLNKGPPRVRPLGRKEMRIETRKLEA
jgi:hypothetical protein